MMMLLGVQLYCPPMADLEVTVLFQVGSELVIFCLAGEVESLTLLLDAGQDHNTGCCCGFLYGMLSPGAQLPYHEESVY